MSGGDIKIKTKPCMRCGKPSVVEVEYEDLKRWQGGAHAQDVWPTWTPEQREVLMTGTHKECWEIMFKEMD